MVVLGFLVSITYAAPASNIPLWIKNNAGWWADDQISDNDYLSGIQYLVTNGIIKIPIKEVIATHSTISDSERAHGFVIRTTGAGGPYYSFSRIVEVGSYSALANVELQLESVPSKDKAEFYKEIEHVLSGQEPNRIDIHLDIITPNGVVLETISYYGCKITNHWVYVNDNKDQYRFTKTDGPEVREVTNFKCIGYEATFP